MLNKTDLAKKEAARQLIREQRYVEAEQLLRGIDDPEIRVWRTKLDALIKPQRPSLIRSVGSQLFKATGAIALAVAIFFGWQLLFNEPRPPELVAILGILLAVAIVSWGFGSRME